MADLDVPNFLQNSPYLPLATTEDHFTELRKSQTRPNIGQILRSKRLRTVVPFVFVVIAFFFLSRWLSSIHFLGRLRGPSCFFNPPIIPPESYGDESTDWSRYAYAQYATSTGHLCNSVMLFDMLHRFDSKADRVLMYPATFLDLEEDSVESRLLHQAQNEYGAKLVPIEIQHKAGEYWVWAESFTKLLAFNQTQYERLLVLDSDSTILRHMDELFFIPSITVAMPHAYWLDHPFLTSHIMVIEPSVHEFSRIQAAMKSAGHGVYDMDVVNTLYGATCLVLPHRKYALLTGEFRSDDHRKYLDGGIWDQEKVLAEARFVHFSDDPLPKPWEVTQRELEKMKPECGKDHFGREDCRNRDVWLEFYRDFKERRRNVCQLLNE